MKRVKIRLDELYPHFVVVVPGERPEADEFENFETDMHEVDDLVLARWQAIQDAFYKMREELRQLHASKTYPYGTLTPTRRR